MKESDFEALAQRIGQRFFSKTPTVRKCCSHESFVAILSFGGEPEDRVIKLARNNEWTLAAECYLYPLMKGAGLPVPEIEFTDSDYPDSELPFTIMRKFSDQTLDGLCAEDSQAALRACEAAGGFIKELNDRFYTRFQEGVAKDELDKGRTAEGGGQDFAPIREYDGHLSERVELYFEGLRRPTQRRLVHGSFTTYNIMADPAGEICVIDCGYLHLSSPFEDLYMLLASHDGWSIGTGRSNQRDALIHGFGGLGPDGIEELRFWEMYHYLDSLRMELNAKGDPAEEVDRIRQTIEGNSPFCLG